MNRKLLPALLLALGAGACSDSPTGLRPNALSPDIILSPGRLSIELRFAESTASAHHVANTCEFSLRVNGNWSNASCEGGSLSLPLPAGSHTIQLQYMKAPGMVGNMSSTQELGAAFTATVTSNATTTVPFDLAPHLGLAKGKLTLNGATPAAGQYAVCLGSFNSTCGSVGAQGEFGVANWEGANPIYVVNRQSNVIAATLTPTFTKGVVVDLGPVNATPGDLRIVPSFGGKTLVEQGVSGTNLCGLWMHIAQRPAGTPLCSWGDASGILRNVQSGERPVDLQMSVGGPTYVPPAKVAATITVSAGQMVDWAPDLASAFALIKGRLTVNGAPPTQPHSACVGFSPCAQTNADGYFTLLAPAGAHTISLRSSSSAVLKEIPTTTTAGQVLDLGTTAVDVGDLTIRLTYLGAPVSRDVSNFCMFQLVVDGKSGQGFLCDWQNYGVVKLNGIAVGRHTVEVHYPSFNALGSPIEVDVAAGQSVTRDIELGSVLGLVSGRVKINNDYPASDNLYQIPLIYRIGTWQHHLAVPVKAGGTFQYFELPGARTAGIQEWNQWGPALSTFGYSVVAGQTTFIGSAEGGAAGVTPTGGNVTVKPVDSATGESTVTLQFGQVTTSGQTTVSSGSTTSSPLPPDVDAGTSPTYYNIETSATFTGTVKLCLKYDPAKYTDLSQLKLYHGNKDGTWSDITTSVDTETHTVCGETSSFSPFVVVQKKSTNRAPVATVGGPYTGAEGTAVSLDLGGTDADKDVLTFAWDLGNGTTGSGSTPPSSAIYPQDGEYTVTLKVTDAKGLSDTKSAKVTVSNRLPTVTIASGATLLQGETYTSAGSFADPGRDPWTAAVRYSEQHAAAALALGSDKTFALSHTYTAAGTHTVTVGVRDDDGTGEGTATVLVKTPEQGIDDLSRLVKGESNALFSRSVRSSASSNGGTTSLLAKLDAAKRQIARGNKAPAIHELRAFIHEVSAMAQGGRLDAALSKRYTDAANRIIRSIG